MISLPEVLVSGLSDCQKKFLNSFKKNHVTLMANTFAMLLYPVWCYLFVVKYELGIAGSSLANVASIMFTFLFSLTYTYTQPDLAETRLWPTLSMFSFSNIIH